MLPIETTTTTGPTDITRDIRQALDGTIWMASWQGIYSYDPTDPKQTFTNHTLKENLAHSRGFTLYEDSQRTMWFGMMGAGVYRYDGHSWHNFTTRDGLGGNTVNAIFEDKDGNMWFGTDSGVSRYDQHRFYTIKTGDGNNSGISAIAQDKDGVMWFGSQRGVWWYVNQQLVGFNSPKGGAIACNALTRDRNGVMWIGGARGLYKYFADEKGAMQLQQVMPNSISYMNMDRAGNILVSGGGDDPTATNGNFIYRISGANSEKVYERKEHGGAGDQVFRVIQDGTGKLWFGCAQGVCRLDDEKAFCFGEQGR